MRFSDYYSSLAPGGKSAMARDLGLPLTFVSSVSRGRRPLPVARWRDACRLSNGVVTLEDLAAEYDAYLATKSTQERAA